MALFSIERGVIEFVDRSRDAVSGLLATSTLGERLGSADQGKVTAEDRLISRLGIKYGGQFELRGSNVVVLPVSEADFDGESESGVIDLDDWRIDDSDPQPAA